MRIPWYGVITRGLPRRSFYSLLAMTDNFMPTKFLLHTCCAPCSIAIIDELKREYDLTVFFYNPNIHPQEEYLHRKVEVINVCNEWGVSMVDADYEVDKWNEAVKGLEKEVEGGARCPLCIEFRLEKAANYAKENGFKVFGTSLTMGYNKKADIIHPIGYYLAEKYGLSFLGIDWKNTGISLDNGKYEGLKEKGRKLVAERGIYRQKYCGCVYSKIKM